MVPTREEAIALWDIYALPESKRNHCTLVAQVAVWFATKLRVPTTLIEVAALLHDIDKAVPRLPGERHPDTAVRILKEHGMDDVADLVKTHPLHAILDVRISPKTWEEKILYLSDKMVKDSIITVDERFALWRAEQLPKDAVEVLDAAYPLAKALEHEVYAKLATNE